MKDNKDLDFENSALILIDMQKGGAPDGELPVQGWNKVVNNAEKVLETCRNHDIPIVHVCIVRRKDGVDDYNYDIGGKPSYYAEGTKAVEIADELKPKDDEIVVKKQRMSSFYQTNMDLILEGLDVNRLIMLGVYTNQCFLMSVYDAFCRGYLLTIVKDACGAGTEAAHKSSILDIANWVYKCSIVEADELVKAINGEDYNGWFWEEPNSVPYTFQNADELYDQLG